jgi:predicted phosphate transport protein (TIGR00153 family)
MPFQKTQVLINEIDEFLDKVSEATMVVEQTYLHYIDKGTDDYLDEKMQQIFDIEVRGDELRRNVATVMYTQMLMPDTREDVLTLLDFLDNVLDDGVHLIAKLCISRPELPNEFRPEFRELTIEVVKACQYMVQAARAYFKEPYAVRDHVRKISFHEIESTKMTLHLGKAIYGSDLPMEHKRFLVEVAIKLREIASHADDVGDRTAIFAIKRSI